MPNVNTSIADTVKTVPLLNDATDGINYDTQSI